MITLTPASVESTVIGGTTVDTSGAAVVSQVVTNFSNQSLQISVLYGTMSGSVFTPSPYTRGQSLTLDLVGGTYSVGNQLPGAIPPALLTSILAVVKTYRNGLESLANAAGAAPGVITPW
jgi:hypothetical protein